MTRIRPPAWFLPTVALTVAALAATGAVAAQDLSALPEGALDAVPVVAADDGVPVRADAGYLYRELRHLSRGQEAIAVERRGDWLRLRQEGWVLVDHVVAPSEEEAGGASRHRLRVTKDGSRLRGGPGTQHSVVGSRAAGDEVVAVAREGDWWQLAGDGAGWIHDSLVQPQGRSASAGATPPVASSAAGSSVPGSGGEDGLRRWSFMDLHGVYFEISEMDPRSGLQPALKRALRQTGMLEHDWTFLRLVVGAPQGPYRFNYSPKSNTTVVVDEKGERYGNVYVEGPVTRLPAALRGFFLPHVVHPGERFEGVLLFRPTLDPDEISSISMFIGGRLQSFYELD